MTGCRLSFFVAMTVCVAAGYGREAPAPLADRPGNVCLEGEPVSVALSAGFRGAVRWEARGLDGGVTARGTCAGDAKRLELGALPLGWYRIDGFDAAGKRRAWTTAAVLKRLAAPVPEDSPVRIDTADAWFTRTGSAEGDRRKMAAFASLAALAGISGVRDRLTWSELEPVCGTFAETTRFDDSARILHAAGLSVLQVFHHTPAWAQSPRLEDAGGTAGKRYPRDLRDAYRFCKAMAGRFNGSIQAWEPWNEANIPGFGGQIIDEMCALQKASYLGFKAGDPAVTVCWNVFAGPGTPLHTQGVIDNACWPYFDTYNIHSYSGVERYANEFAPARTGACGKPMWISECGIHVNWNADHGDLSDAEGIRQAQFVPKSYASSLFAGISRHYFFILGNYCEGKVQFGLLRHDLTPRRGYLALAAVGRLLAGAKPLGRLTNGVARVYAFRACPDGNTRDVLVAWADKGTAASPCAGETAEAVCDNYGRRLAGGMPSVLTEAPVFAVLPSGGAARLSLEPPLEPSPAPDKRLAASPVVMQAVLPQAQTLLGLQAHQIKAGGENIVPVAVYNFSDRNVAGTLKLERAPTSMTVVSPVRKLVLRPMERQVIGLKVALRQPAGRAAMFGETVCLRGVFGAAGTPVLAFRLACDPSAVTPVREWPLACAAQTDVWADNIVGGARMTHAAQDGRMVFTMDFGEQDPWGYPRLKLDDAQRPPEGADGLMAEIEVLEGSGTLRVQFIEQGGSAYLTELPYRFEEGGKQNLVAFFDKASWGSHSRPDADNKLSPAEISGVMIGINARRNSRVRLAIGHLRWVRY